jgi:hypothetical protein
MQRRLDYAEEPERATMKSTLRIGLCAFGLTASTLASAEELGRLFFTPEQRAQLDYNYAQGADSTNNSSTLMLNGIVQKHGGKRTVWINGVPQQAGSSDDKTPESQSVQVPGTAGTVKLKVGQRVLLGPSDNPDTVRPDTPDTPRQ